MMDIKKVKFVMQIRQVENTSEDCNLIYNLSNDPLVRANSFNSEPIIYENHVKWFNKVIKPLFYCYNNVDKSLANSR